MCDTCILVKEPKLHLYRKENNLIVIFLLFLYLPLFLVYFRLVPSLLSPLLFTLTIWYPLNFGLERGKYMYLHKNIFFFFPYFKGKIGEGVSIGDRSKRSVNVLIHAYTVYNNCKGSTSKEKRKLLYVTFGKVGSIISKSSERHSLRLPSSNR